MAGSIKKDKHGWYYVLELGKNSNNKRIQKKKRGFRTKLEAQKELTKVQHDLYSGAYIEPSKMLLRNFLYQYLAEKETQVTSGTLKNYKRLIVNHINPVLGEIEISNISPSMIQDLYTKLKQSGKMSDENVRKVHTIIKDSYNKAERRNMIIKNPARLVDAPKIRKPEVRYWDKDQVKKFLDSVSTSRYSAAFITEVTTGMRRGELLGLQWSDVDFIDGNLHVSKILSNDEEKDEDGKEKGIVHRTKTLASKRTIAIPEKTIEALKEHKNRINNEKQNANDLYTDNNLVFCTSTGRPCSPRNLLRVLKEHIKKTGVPDIRFHDIRHTHATLLLKQKANPKIVAERLGHANVRTTLDIYSHLMPGMQKETARDFGKMLFD